MLIEETACKVLRHLQAQPDQTIEAMHLKLALELSASKLFLALGWLSARGTVDLETSEYGFVVRCRSGVQQELVQEAVERR